MIALKSPQPVDIIPFPRVWTPEADEGRAPRTITPGGARKKRAPQPGQQALFEGGASEATRQISEQVARSYRDPVVPEINRAWMRDNMTLRGFYEDWLLTDKEARLATGRIARGTLSKDRQAIARWERFSRPTEVPAAERWQGVTLGAISGRYVTEVLSRMRASGMADDTVRSTWNHLRSILNYAAKVRAIDLPPEPERVKAPDRKVRIYRAEQIEAAYQALSAWIDLQVAFVLALNAGPRTVDVFRLRWDNCDLCGPRPTITFRAKKTGKEQTVPLAPVTIHQIERLPSRGRSEWLFPGRTSPQAEDPERSHVARERRRIISKALANAGIHFAKPFQVARATCNTRLEEVRQGAGVFVLGHGLTLNARNYTEPSDLVFEAVLAVRQPDCFREGLSA